MTLRGVFAVPVGDRWLVHAPLNRLTALVNRAAVEVLARGAPLPGMGPVPAVEPEPRARWGPFDPAFLGLIPTRACNMACAYCGFGGAPDPSCMDPRLACAAVDWMAEHAAGAGRSRLAVHFFGGEPMMAPDVVEAAVHRTRARAAQEGLRPRIEISTNGVYGEPRATFLGEFLDAVSLSFDGFAPVQDRHRALPNGRGAFHEVCRTAHILSRSRAALCLRICVARDNIGELAETVEWFCREFRPAAIAVETLQPTPESERAGLRPPDPYEFAARLLQARRVAAAYGVGTVYSAVAAERPRITFCPLGDDIPILHPDGVITACYLLERDWHARGLDLRLGGLDRDGTLHLDEDALARVRQLAAHKPHCQRCFCRWSCAGGCHVNHSSPGCSPLYDDCCLQTRSITALLLLAGLDQAELAGALALDRAALERLATWPDDRLEQWGAACGQLQAENRGVQSRNEI